MLTVRKATVKEWRKELEVIDKIIELIEFKQLHTEYGDEYNELNTLLHEYEMEAEKIRIAINKQVVQIEF